VQRIHRAEVARRLSFTRARITHLLDLTLLAPDLQEQVLMLEAIDGAQPLSERVLRAVARGGSWQEQRRLWLQVGHLL
jgi:ParB-like chromosome segregation protein Spo0J